MKSAYHKKLLHALTDARKSLSEKQALSRVVAADLARLTHEVVDLEAALKHESEKALTVSEHGLLRYFERIMGYDLDLVAKAILPETVRAQIETLGDGHYPVVDGKKEFTIVVRARTVVTIETKEKEGEGDK